MAIHKFLFWIVEEGIQSYRVTQVSKFEQIKYQGNPYFPSNDIKQFFNSNWFNNIASIAKEDYIDFCFLSEFPIDSFKFNHFCEEKSSWNKKAIRDFCSKYVRKGNYRIIVENQTNFLFQSQKDKEDQWKELYLQCIPKFSNEEQNEEIELKTEDTSILYRYYKEILNSL